MTAHAEPTIREHDVSLSDVRLHVAEAGEGPLVLLLHGFPDIWWTWHHQIAPLAAAGYRVVAPDMRGYGFSDKPEGVGRYRLDVLARDVADLIDHFGGGTGSVVGHDWGGIVAWHAALRHSDRVTKLAICNAPPPLPLLARWVPPTQLFKSLYVAAFQVPVLPERALALDDFAVLRRALAQGTTSPDAYSEADWDRLETAWRQPGALTSMLNYYRALVRHGAWETSAALMRSNGYPHPMLVLWGDKDPYLSSELALPDPRRVPKAREVHYPTAGHWVHLDRPDEVTRELLAWMKEG
jgi:pimeloyl-ACP methyl ester carboxylesterase